MKMRMSTDSRWPKVQLVTALGLQFLFALILLGLDGGQWNLFVQQWKYYECDDIFGGCATTLWEFISPNGGFNIACFVVTLLLMISTVVKGVFYGSGRLRPGYMIASSVFGLVLWLVLIGLYFGLAQWPQISDKSCLDGKSGGQFCTTERIGVAFLPFLLLSLAVSIWLLVLSILASHKTRVNRAIMMHKWGSPSPESDHGSTHRLRDHPPSFVFKGTSFDPVYPPSVHSANHDVERFESSPLDGKRFESGQLDSEIQRKPVAWEGRTSY